MSDSYQNKRSFKERRELYESLHNQFPECVPVIVERHDTEKDLPLIQKRRFIVPTNMNVQNFITVIRSRISLEPGTALWICVGNQLLCNNSDMIGDVYNKFKDPDGFLYITYRGEDRFG